MTHCIETIFIKSNEYFTDSHLAQSSSISPLQFVSDALETSQDPRASEESDTSLHVRKGEIEAALKAVVASRDRVTAACLVAPPESLYGPILGSISLAAQLQGRYLGML